MQTMTEKNLARLYEEHNLRIKPGNPYPMGATWDGLGVNFTLYSQHAERVELLLFESEKSKTPLHVLDIKERTGPIWHVYVYNLQPGQLYGYRVYGPYEPEKGRRFNSKKVLLDPYARAIGRQLKWDDSLFGYKKGHADQDVSFSKKIMRPMHLLELLWKSGSNGGTTSGPEFRGTKPLFMRPM